MGYLPKHVKRAYQRDVLRLVAHAALAGAMFIKTPSDEPWWGNRSKWDWKSTRSSQSGGWFNSRRAAAINFMLHNGYGDTIRDWKRR